MIPPYSDSLLVLFFLSEKKTEKKKKTFVSRIPKHERFTVVFYVFVFHVVSHTRNYREKCMHVVNVRAGTRFGSAENLANTPARHDTLGTVRPRPVQVGPGLTTNNAAFQRFTRVEFHTHCFVVAAGMAPLVHPQQRTVRSSFVGRTDLQNGTLQ